MVNLQENLDAIHELNAEVVGISNAVTVPQMADKFHLTFPMLLDENADVCRLYETFDEPTHRVHPMTLVIDKKGIIYSKYPYQLSDSESILADLQALEEAAP